MKNVILIIFIVTNFLCACTSKNDDLPFLYENWKLYSNDYFYIGYPPNFEYHEEFNNMCDTIPSLKKGLRLNLYNPSPSAPQHWVSVQKSVMLVPGQTAEFYRDLSIDLKQYDEDYIGEMDLYMLDSLQMGPYPAAMAGFVLLGENGDTLIHKQWCVVADNDCYYINNTFKYDDTRSELRGDSIIDTFQFKKRD